MIGSPVPSPHCLPLYRPLAPLIMLKGSFVALVTPMSADGRIDYECLARLIDWHIEAGSNGLVIAGTTGESATLSRTEHVDL